MNLYKGFTIIELIVVIAIIAVLTGVVLSSVNGYMNKAKVAASKAQIQQLTKYTTMYYEANGSMAGFCSDITSLNILQSLKKAAGNKTWSVSCADSTTGYMSFDPDPWTVYARPLPPVACSDSAMAFFMISGLPTDLVSSGCLCGSVKAGGDNNINVNVCPVLTTNTGCLCQ
jgi:prepilin-type N-terminal cleavage/methylation domain-containing protein